MSGREERKRFSSADSHTPLSQSLISYSTGTLSTRAILTARPVDDTSVPCDSAKLRREETPQVRFLEHFPLYHSIKIGTFLSKLFDSFCKDSYSIDISCFVQACV